jgi:exosortase
MLFHWENTTFSALPIPWAPAKYALLGLGAAITLWFYVPVLMRLGVTWWTYDYADYLPLVPLFSALLVWQQREELRTIPRRPWLGGLALVLIALGSLLVGRVWNVRGFLPSQVPLLTIETASLILLIWGGVLTLCGRPLTRRLAFPLGFLLFMLPFTRSGVTSITRQLQHLTAWAGTVGLDTLGIPVYQEGLLLYLPTIILEIDKGCSGWTYLWTLVIFGSAFAHVTQPSFWCKGALITFAVPFALFANALRVVGTGAIGYLVGPEAITGVAHEYFGHAVYWTLMGLFIGFGFLLKRRSGNASSYRPTPLYSRD